MADRHSNASKTGNNSENKVETLFVTKNVQEIKQVERKMRLDIERKKEELRQLVGERYHDMIEAADSVIKMKEDAKNVVSILTDILKECRDIQQTHLLKGTGGQQTPPTIDTSASIAAQMRLIMDLQFKIWNYLEENQYLSATLCFLIVRNASSRMRTLESMEWPQSVMLQYMNKIPSFKTIIIKGCRNYLKSPSLSIENEQMIVNTCVSLLLLESCGMETVLTWFLEDRQASIENVFSEKVQSVKRTVSDVLSIIRNTIILLYRIFLPSDNDSRTTMCLITRCLREVTDINSGFCINYIPQDLVARLPHHITSYSPNLSISDIPMTLITQITTDWIDKCVDATKVSFGDVLVHVSNLKSLAGIREAVHQLLSQPCLYSNDTSESINSNIGSISSRFSFVESEWTNITTSLLNNQLCIYSKFIRQLLLDQAKVILSSQLKEFGSFVENLLEDLVAKHCNNPDDFILDSNLSYSLWDTRDERDLLGGTGYETGMLNLLRMKAKGCSPQINIFCNSASTKLQSTVDDLNYIVCTSESTKSEHSIVADYPFDVKADFEPLLNVLEGLVSNTINSFTSLIDQNSSLIEIELCKGQQSDDSTQITHLQDRLLLLARLCQCFIDFIPNLKHLVYLPTQRLPWKQGISKKFPKDILNVKSSSNDNLEILLLKADQLLSIWSKNLAACFTKLFKLCVSNEIESTTSLCSATVWEEIKVAEEAETGVEISSNIRLPAQASIYVVTLLYSLCQEITRGGSHFISQTILRDLVFRIFVGITDLYMGLFNQSADPVSSSVFNQEYILQLLFDYRLLSSILWYPSTDPVAEKHDKLVDTLLSHIDPFDYDVFTPHLSRLLERQLQRSTVMFGLLLALKEQVFVSSSQYILSTSQERHIIIPLSSPLPRIPLLPGSSSKSIPSKALEVSSNAVLSSISCHSFFKVAAALKHV